MNEFGSLIVLSLVFGVTLLWALGTFNGLVRLRNHCDESWSNIDTELQRRHHLIPNLVRTVREYADHERDVLRQVTEAREVAHRPGSGTREQSQQESELVEKIERLLMRVEAYPDLKADRHFLELQEELVRTEDRIQHARRIYNANVRDLNNRIEIFPANLIASAGKFRKRDYFEVASLRVRTVPSVR